MTRNQLAARCIARHATDAADARLLLEALGLLTDNGIAADDLRDYEVGTAYDNALYGRGQR